MPNEIRPPFFCAVKNLEPRNQKSENQKRPPIWRSEYPRIWPKIGTQTYHPKCQPKHDAACTKNSFPQLHASRMNSLCRTALTLSRCAKCMPNCHSLETPQCQKATPKTTARMPIRQIHTTIDFHSNLYIHVCSRSERANDWKSSQCASLRQTLP